MGLHFRAILFSISIDNLGMGLECVLSMYTDDAKLREAVDSTGVEELYRDILIHY